jgi:Protein of unknown function (DUF1367)
MAIDVLMVKEKGRLVPADSLSADAIATIREKEYVTAVIRRPRNPGHHRKLWALLTVVFEAQSAFATTYDLLNAIKIATGLFDTGKTVDGIPWVSPGSIAFASMDQTRFEEWYRKAVDVILTKIIPNTQKADLEQQVHAILAGYA